MGKLVRIPKAGTLRVKRAWENFEASVGGREDLIALLEYADDGRAVRLLDHLSDPRAERLALRRLALDARVSFAQLYSIFSDALNARNQMAALLVTSKHVRQVIEDIAEDAQAHNVPCPVCQGSGGQQGAEGTNTCYRCEGAGKVREPGSLEAAELFLKVAGLLKRDATVDIVQNVNTTAMASLPTLEEVIMCGHARRNAEI